MIPVDFEESNTNYGPPSDLDESQCATVKAYRGTVLGGPVDGVEISVVAWKPSPQEISDILAGSPIYVSVMGGLAPHVLGTSFKSVVGPCA